MLACFEPSEYLWRLTKVKQRMSEDGVDVLLATNPSNMCYLTGYDGWSFYVHQLVIIAMDHPEPIWVGRGMDANGAKATTYLNDANIYGYPDHYVQSTARHPMEYVADLIREKGWAKKTIGVEMDTYYFTAACYLSLQHKLPNARFKDTTTLVNWIRVIKSPMEIEFMNRAARIIEKVMQVGIDAINPGVRQCDAVAAIYQAQISGHQDHGGDYTAICPMLPTGRGTSTPHLTWSDEPYVPGEATILELAGCYRRYHCPMARTVHLGRPPKKLIDMSKVIIEGLNNALESAQPGVTCEEVEAVWRKTINKYGITKESRIGYSTGLNYPPDWGENTLSLRPGDRTVLQPNMTIHMIPGIWMDDWGIEISECFMITDTGAQCFAEFPQQLWVKQ